MTIMDFLNAIKDAPIEIHIPIFAIITEISDEPCAAEARVFATEEAAKKALKKQLNDILECYEFPQEKIDFIRKNYEENFEKAFVATLDEDDCVQYYARIECLQLEN